MIDRQHDLPITKQAEVLRISRGSVYYLPRAVPEADLAIMRRLDRLHLEFPFAGSRMLRGLLAAEGSNPKFAGALYGRGLAKQKKGDRAGADADFAAAKTIRPDIADEFAKFGIE